MPIPSIFGKTSRTDVFKKLPVTFTNCGEILYSCKFNGTLVDLAVLIFTRIASPFLALYVGSL